MSKFRLPVPGQSHLTNVPKNLTFPQSHDVPRKNFLNLSPLHPRIPPMKPSKNPHYDLCALFTALRRPCSRRPRNCLRLQGLVVPVSPTHDPFVDPGQVIRPPTNPLPPPPQTFPFKGPSQPIQIRQDPWMKIMGIQVGPPRPALLQRFLSIPGHTGVKKRPLCRRYLLSPRTIC